MAYMRNHGTPLGVLHGVPPVKRAEFYTPLLDQPMDSVMGTAWHVRWGTSYYVLWAALWLTP